MNVTWGEDAGKDVKKYKQQSHHYYFIGAHNTWGHAWINAYGTKTIYEIVSYTKKCFVAA